jgi:hypothetical protein
MINTAIYATTTKKPTTDEAINRALVSLSTSFAADAARIPIRMKAAIPIPAKTRTIMPIHPN